MCTVSTDCTQVNEYVHRVGKLCTVSTGRIVRVLDLTWNCSVGHPSNGPFVPHLIPVHSAVLPH